MAGMKTICGLWTRTSKKSGKKFMTGLDIRAIQSLNADAEELLIFKNEKKKEGSKEADFQVVAVEKQQRQSPKPPPPSDDPFDGF